MGSQTSRYQSTDDAGADARSHTSQTSKRKSIHTLIARASKHRRPRSATSSTSRNASPSPPPPPTKATRTGRNEAGGAANTEEKAAPRGTERAEMKSSGSDSQPPNQNIMPAPATVPCQYRTGKTLGSGTYAIVKEAVHIKTGKYYACKVINKKLMEGREYMVRNEIAVLKRVSQGHRNIVTLHDYFETSHNLYLVFDLCTGGELFDRICAKGNYYEADAAALVRTVFRAVKWIHDCGIVHRDLKPENLLFRTKDEDADIMIADFGLSRVMDEDKLQVLTEICGTPGYMAPEIFKKTGHGKPVDVWAMGVITYFLLCGYTPFDRESQQDEMEAIIAGDYKFEPEEYWANVSETARDFVRYCLTIDPNKRPTAAQALEHKWLAEDSSHFVADREGAPMDLLPFIQKQFDAKKTWRKAVFSITAVKRMSMGPNKSQYLSPAAQALAPHLQQYKEESEKEVIDEEHSVMHYDEGGSAPSSPAPPKSAAAASAEKQESQPLSQAMAKMSIDQKS